MGGREDGDGGQREGKGWKEGGWGWGTKVERNGGRRRIGDKERERGSLKRMQGGRNRGGTNSQVYGNRTEAHTTSLHCQCTPQSQSTCGSDINHFQIIIFSTLVDVIHEILSHHGQINV